MTSSEANWSRSTLFAKTGHVVFSRRRVKTSDEMFKNIAITISGSVMCLCERTIVLMQTESRMSFNSVSQQTQLQLSGCNRKYSYAQIIASLALWKCRIHTASVAQSLTVPLEKISQSDIITCASWSEPSLSVYTSIEYYKINWWASNDQITPLPKHAYSNTEMYIENFPSKNWKFSDNKLWYFSYFCSKHRLWVLVRTAASIEIIHLSAWHDFDIAFYDISFIRSTWP